MVRELPEDPVFAMIELAKGKTRGLNEIEEAVMEEIRDKLERG